MRSFYALLAKDLQLFFSRAGVAAMVLPLILLAALALGGGDLSRQAYIAPFPIAIRDEDRTLMSASLTRQIEEVALFSEIYDGGGATDEALMARGAAAVVTIPKDFFYDLYTMEPVTVDIALNASMDLESSLLYAVFTSVMDIISANESVQLAVYDYCYGDLDAEEEAQLWDEYSKLLLRDALGRQLVFDTELTASDTVDTVQSALRLCALSMLCLFFPMAVVQAVPSERDRGLLARYGAAGGALWAFLLSKLAAGLLLTLPTLAVVLALFCRDCLLWAILTALAAFLGAFGVLLALAVTAPDSAAAQRRGNLFLLLNLLLGGAVYPLPLLPQWTQAAARLTLPYAITLGLEGGFSPALLWPLGLGVGGFVWSAHRLRCSLSMERQRRKKGDGLALSGRWMELTALKGRAMSGGWPGFVALCILALLCGGISQTAVGDNGPAELSLAVIQQDDSNEAQALVERLEQVDGLTLYAIDADAASDWLRWGKAEGVLTIGHGYGEALANNDDLPLSYQSAAAAATNQAAREIVAGQVIVQRAQLRGLSDAEGHLGRRLTPSEQTELLAQMEARYEALPPLYAVTSGSGAPSAVTATAPLLGGTLLLILFTMLTWGAWMARPDVVRVEGRMAAMPGGRCLSYGTDLLSLWFTGGMAGAAALLVLDAQWSQWIAVAVYILALGAAVRALTRCGVGGRVDILAPFLALVTSLLGGCFCPLDQLSPWLERLSWFTPQGLALQGRYGILLAATAALLWLGRPRRT